jgi:hypothetical protein
LSRKNPEPIATGVKYQPRGPMLWLQIFIGGFFVVFGIFILVLGLASSAATVLVWLALFFFALATFVIVNMLGFRS